MSDEPAPPGPLSNLISAAHDGSLGLRIAPEEFVYIDRDCERFKVLIRTMQKEAEAISNIEAAQWGIGADNPRLSSAQTLVQRFREKGKGSDNSVHAILEKHYRIIDDIQVLHREIMQRYMQSDEDFANRVNSVLAQLPKNPAPIDPAQSQPGIGQPEPLAPA
ncbi:hypothetical protein [Nocardia sp. NPDC019395]|uniref:hypothetical protein n=1 Tax=Nocardia sp. NPDC019395 TaxID=3154686 RepID=UPI0033F19D80